MTKGKYIRTKSHCEALSKSHLGKTGWNKGLTKETDIRVKQISDSLSKGTMSFTCEYCGQIQYTTIRLAKIRKYCSLKCKYAAGVSKTLRKNISKNTKLAMARPEVKTKMLDNQPDRSGKNHPMYGKFSENNPNWKDATVRSRHGRIMRLKGKASTHKCIDCGKEAKEWSNVDHLYSLEPDDYQSRCNSCHQLYDIQLRKKQRKNQLLSILKKY